MSDRRRDIGYAVARYAHTLNHLGPWHGPDLLAGMPDARHRSADAIASLYKAGEHATQIGLEHGVPAAVVNDVAAAYLAMEVALLRARIPVKEWGAVVTEAWPPDWVAETRKEAS